MENIPDYLEEPMKYLSFIFSKSIRNNVSTEEDLYHDLIVFYLEKKNSKQAIKVSKQSEQRVKDYWYRCFKNYLINKYTRSVTERKIKEKLKETYADKQRTTKSFN